MDYTVVLYVEGDRNTYIVSADDEMSAEERAVELLLEEYGNDAVYEVLSTVET